MTADVKDLIKKMRDLKLKKKEWQPLRKYLRYLEECPNSHAIRAIELLMETLQDIHFARWAVGEAIRAYVYKAQYDIPGWAQDATECLSSAGEELSELLKLDWPREKPKAKSSPMTLDEWIREQGAGSAKT